MQQQCCQVYCLHPAKRCQSQQDYHLSGKHHLGRKSSELQQSVIPPCTGVNAEILEIALCAMLPSISNSPVVCCRGLATEQAVRSELRMHGLLPYRHTSLHMEIDRAYAAIQACNRDMDKYQVYSPSKLVKPWSSHLPTYYTTAGLACSQSGSMTRGL